MSTDRRITLGNVLAGTTTTATTWPDNSWGQGSAWTVVTPPTICQANLHVFPCDHAITCKCGQSSRQAPAPPTCAGCGKTL